MDATIIRQVPLFEGLDEATLGELYQKMSEVTLRRGEVLFEENDDADQLYIVTEGKVKLGHTTSDGRENLLAILGPGEILGELTLFDRVAPVLARLPQSPPPGCCRWHTPT